VVLDDNYPPYVFRDEEGNLQGILVDEWALFGRRTGVRVELRGMNWGDALERMARGDFDVIDTMFRNPQRERSFDFSEPYARIDVPLFFRKELSGIRDASSLGNLRVAVKRGDNAILFLRERGATNLAEYDSYEEIVRAAVSGDETVFVTDEPPALFFLYRLGARDLFRRTRALYAGEFHRAVRKGDRATLRLLERGFRAISPEEYGEIRDRWTGEPLLSPEAERMIRIGLPLAGTVLLSLLLGMWGLRRMVRIRTAELNVQMALAEERAEALRESEARYRALFESAGDGILLLGADGRIVDCNRRLEELFRMPRDLLLGAHPGELSPDVQPDGELSPEMSEGYIGRAGGGFPQFFPWRHRRGDGTLFDCEISLKRVDSEGGALMQGIVRDVSERLRAEEALRESEERYRQLFEMESDAIFLIDNETGRILEANEAASELYGFSREELRGLRNVDLSAEPESTRARTREGASEIPLRWHRKRDGSIFPVEIMARHFDWRGRRVHIAAIRDITQRRRAEEQLRFLSLHDALTGLFNRARFEEELDRLDRRREGAVGILMVDVDGLKLANDTFGHERGDALLIEAARVLQDSLREGDLIARIGGDEFAALLPEIRGDDLDRVVARIRSNLEAREKREDPAGPPLVPRFSLGTALSASPAEPLRDVLRIADDRMYRDKLHRQGNARSAVLSTLTSLLAERDYVTEGHGERMADLTLALAEKVGFPEAERGDLVLFARFHDLGKVGIPDRILKKPGPLTPEETREMRRHPEVGRRIAHSLPELQPVAEWILLHHEWWNGGGYPLGLEGERIPLACRVLAVVDAFDAMTGDRPYRRALSEEEALEEIRRGAGSQFDPDLAAAFVRLVESGGLRGDRAGEQGRYAGRAGIAGEEETRT